MKRWKINSLIALVLLAWTLWPVICVTVAMVVADLAGATLDEGGAHPCVIMGVDCGEALSTLFVLGWLGLITLPTGGIGLLLFGIIATIEWRYAVRRKAAAIGSERR